VANTKTLIDTIPTRVGGVGPVYEYEIVIDTTATDLTIRTPVTATNRLWIVGIWLSEGTAVNLTLKSGTTKSHTLELATNQSLIGKTEKDSFYFVTAPGDDLILQASAAIGASVGKNFVLRVVEGQNFN
jgi:hypothetical protein